MTSPIESDLEEVSDTPRINTKNIYLNTLYYDPDFPGFLAPPELLYNTLHKGDYKYKFTRKELFDWLSSQEIFLKYNKKRKNKRYRRLYTSTTNQIFDIDSAYYGKKLPGKYKYFVTAVDNFSKKKWAVATLDLKSKSIINAIKEINANLGAPSSYRSDRGSEYQNAELSKFLKKENINSFTAGPPLKASAAERAIRSQKSLLSKLVDKYKPKSWHTLVPLANKILNSKYSRTIGMTPNEASLPENHYKVLSYVNNVHLQKQGEPQDYFSYPLNQRVKIKLTKSAFGKDNTPSFSDDVYEIYQQKKYDNIDYYVLQTADGTIVDSPFTAGEIIPIKEPDTIPFTIKKILPDKKVIKFIPYTLVQWMNGSESFIPVHDLRHFMP